MKQAHNLLGAASLALVLAIVAPPVGAQGVPSYTVRQLLQPCVEGDNDSRDGAVLEMECEQYILGFTDLYLHAKLNEQDKVCLPETGNRADEIRWAFMRWAHEHFDQRDMSAVDGLMATVKARFQCE